MPRTSRVVLLVLFLALLWTAAPAEAAEKHTRGLRYPCLSPDGQRVLSGGEWGMHGKTDYAVRLWNTVSGACLCTFEGHTSEVTSVCLSPDGRWALSGSLDKAGR